MQQEGLELPALPEVVERISAFTEVAKIDRFTYQGDCGGQPWPIEMRSLDLYCNQMDRLSSLC